MLNLATLEILNILYDRHGMEYLTRDKHGNLESWCELPEYKDDEWVHNTSNSYFLEEEAYYDMILDNDLDINPEDVNLSFVTLEVSPLLISNLIQNNR